MADANLKKAGEDAAKSLNEATWMEESFKLAKGNVYDERIMQVLIDGENDLDHELDEIALDTDYSTGATQVAEKRIVEAGFRLAAELKKLFP